MGEQRHDVTDVPDASARLLDIITQTAFDGILRHYER